MQCMHGKLKIVKVLIKAEANINSKDKLGWTPLHWASHHWHIKSPSQKHLFTGIISFYLNPLYAFKNFIGRKY